MDVGSDVECRLQGTISVICVAQVVDLDDNQL